MTQDHTADRSLQFLMKWLLSLQCMHSCFIQHYFLSDTHCALCLFSFCSCDNDMLSEFSVHVVCVRLLCDDSSCHNTWATAFWIEFKLWLTHCSKIMYSSYDTEIEMTIRAHMSVMSRLLLRNVFLTASSHFKPSAFNSIHLKVVRCLANGFFSVLKLLRYKSLSFFNSESLYACQSWLISFSMIIWFKTLFDLIQATIQGMTWLCKYQNCTLTLLFDMFTFNLATICCSQGLNFTLFSSNLSESKDIVLSVNSHSLLQWAALKWDHLYNWLILRRRWCCNSWCWDSCIYWCSWCEIVSIHHKGVKKICISLHVSHVLFCMTLYAV
jgi:hypothetical protein